MPVQFSIDDLRTPESLERVLRQFEAALITPTPSVRIPTLGDLVAKLAPLLRDQLQAPGQTPLNLTALLPSQGQAVLLEDTHANRLTLYPASNYSVGTVFYETDRTIVYAVTSSSGTLVWTYIVGVHDDVLASIPTDLSTNDAGFLFEVTNYDHILQWTGSAWTWGPGEVGSGYYILYEAAPNSVGASSWQICDGSTVARLNADGTTTNVTVPDVSTAVYLKAGTVSAAVAASSGLTTSVSGGTPAGTVSQPTFTGNAVAAASTAATPDLVAPDTTATGVSPVTTATGIVSQPTFTGNVLAGHDHGPNTLELRNKQARLYYRR